MSALAFGLLSLTDIKHGRPLVHKRPAARPSYLREPLSGTLRIHGLSSLIPHVIYLYQLILRGRGRAFVLEPDETNIYFMFHEAEEDAETSTSVCVQKHMV